MGRIPLKLFLKDQDSRYISVNESYATDFKTSRDTFVGKDDFEFYPRPLAEKYRADDAEVMASARVKDIEESYVVDGRQYWVRTIKAPVPDDEGNIVALLGLFDDITERKKAEEELAKHRDNLEDLVRERTAEIQEKNKQLERMNQLFIGREFRIKELREKIKQLEGQG